MAHIIIAIKNRNLDLTKTRRLQNARKTRSCNSDNRLQGTCFTFTVHASAQNLICSGVNPR